MSTAELHLRDLQRALVDLGADAPRLEEWGADLAVVLHRGGRLLVAGNGGSAAQAQHLTAELVGRYLDERAPMSALALHAESSSLTAIVNDYGADQAFARQVLAHGRPGDVLLGLSTSGRSPNVLRAADAAHRRGMRVLALTGPLPNALAEAADDAVGVDASTPTVQEVHQVAIHLLCAAIDAALPTARPAAPTAARPAGMRR
jgi:D-sedoheptulose 7-phosphate isomerase